MGSGPNMNDGRISCISCAGGTRWDFAYIHWYTGTCELTRSEEVSHSWPENWTSVWISESNLTFVSLSSHFGLRACAVGGIPFLA